MRRLAVFLMCVWSSLSFAGERVKVAISSKWEKEQLVLSFKVSPLDKLHKLNLEAPWRLKLGEQLSKSFAKTTYTQADFKKDLPGYAILSQVSADKDLLKTIPYELTAYTCTKDGSQCFHEFLKGDYHVENIPNSSNKNLKR